jgi:hypothetical protein
VAQQQRRFYALGVRWLVVSSWLVLTMAAHDAKAYCRTSTCGEGVEGTRCDPPQAGDCGEVIAWKRDCIGFSMQGAGSRQVASEVVASLLTQAFAEWMRAPCGAGSPHIRIDDLGPVSCGTVEYNQHDGNANVVVFRDDVWPHDDKVNALALTTVTYDLDTGEIFDADIEVNGTRKLVANDAGDWYDLLGVLNHEAGHALGLAHSPVPEATMEATIEPADRSFRILHSDDIAGICATYPPGEDIDPTCNPIPRHGFSDQCRSNQQHVDCGLSSGPVPRGASYVWVAALLALWRRRARWRGR